MPAKQYKPEVITSQELTPIEKELLEYAKKGQPVLLFGDDGDDIDAATDRKNLILRIHKRSLCLAEKPFLKSFHSDSVIKQSIQQEYFNCATISGIYEAFQGILIDSPSLRKVREIFYPFEGDSLSEFVDEFNLRNLCFLDNLPCNSPSDDEKGFKSSGDMIEDWKTSSWIVVYTYTLNSLPLDFRKHFREERLGAGRQTAQGSKDMQESTLKIKATPKKITKVFFSYNEKGRIILFVKAKGEPLELTEQEGKLFIYLKEDRRTPEEIINHIWEVYKPKDLHKKRGNVMELRSRINDKYSKIGEEALISELIDGCYSLTIEAVER